MQMSKRNKKAKKEAKARQIAVVRQGRSMGQRAQFLQSAMRASALIEAGKASEALAILEPLLETNPRSVELFSVAGAAYLAVGDTWSAIDAFEQAQKIHTIPEVWTPLAGLYTEVGMNMHALQAARRAIKADNEPEAQAELQKLVHDLEADIARLQQDMHVSAAQAETALRHHDDSLRALSFADYQGCIDACRRAIRLLGNWPPAHNNLATALYYHGQLAEAVTTTQNLLANAPNNIHALSNIIKFLAWSGKEVEARSYWERLRDLEPANETDRIKKAEAAAILEEDESVYQILKPVVEAGFTSDSAIALQSWLRFVVAEANIGRTKSALNRIREMGGIEAGSPLQPIYEALKAKQPGLGWSTRYPYFSFPEILPASAIEMLISHMDEDNEFDDQHFDSFMARFAESYPQTVLVGKKLIWEEQQPVTGIKILAALGTSEAYSLMREFGLSQLGDDEDRMEALLMLMDAGQIDPNEPVRVWSEGEWQEVRLASIEFSDEPDVIYPPHMIELMQQAHDAYNRANYAESERLFQQVLTLEPDVPEAYHNLGTIYIRQDELESAKAMFYKALEIRPTYTLPRCHLANILLDEEDLEGAKEIILPVVTAAKLNETEMSVYLYVQARILAYEEQFKKAREILERLLEISPDFAPAQEMLHRLTIADTLQRGLGDWIERSRRRHEKKRAAMQTKFTTADVTLDKALGLYNREIQITMARIIIPEAGIWGLKKKELHERLVAALQEPLRLHQLVAGLNGEERAALRAVVRHGGTMPWSEFDQQYGNDLQENPDWQYEAPTTLMSHLRQRGLLTEAKVNNQLLIVVPTELRKPLADIL
jgi:tetratricopeptide (TPR) repeat protein